MGAQKRSQSGFFVHHIYRRALRFLKDIASRIDLPNFPGSCCG